MKFDAVLITTATLMALFSDPGLAETVTFNEMPLNQAPIGMSIALTGQGKPPVWQVQAVNGGSERVVVQSTAEPIDYRYPLLILDDVSVKDFHLSVKFRPISGKVDQAAGLVWRYIDASNYYVVRANALENNVVLYKVENGKRIDLPLRGKGRTYGAVASVSKTAWNSLTVDVDGSAFIVSLNGHRLYEVQDQTFMNAGNVGLWTKADSVMMFDDLVVNPVK